MRRILATALACLTLALPVTAMAQRELIAFVALRTGNKIQTNYDIQDFLIASKLTDAGKQELFKKAGGDFNRYENLVRNWAKERFDLGLRQVAYFELLKKHSLQNLERGQPRQYFNATERAWFDRLQAEESRVLKHLLDQRLGIVKSRDMFGAWLKEQGYPHAQADSNTDIYFRWYEALKMRLKVEMQMEELQKYEIAMAIKKNYNNLEPSPREIFDLGKTSNELIDEMLEGKLLTQEEIDQLSVANPDLLVMVKDIKFSSLNSSRTEVLAASEDTKDILEQARQELAQAIETKGQENILKYINLAEHLRAKYNDKEELTTLARNALDRFMSSGDFNDYVLGRLYKLAAQYNTASDASDAMATIAPAFTSALEAAINFEVGAQNFEEAVYQAMLSKLPQDNDIVSEASSLIAWVVKFEAKKVTLKYAPKMNVERYDYKTFEGQKRIRDHVKMTRVQNGLKKFRNDDVRNLAWMIDIRNYDQIFTGDRTFNYLMGIED